MRRIQPNANIVACIAAMGALALLVIGGCSKEGTPEKAASGAKQTSTASKPTPAADTAGAAKTSPAKTAKGTAPAAAANPHAMAKPGSAAMPQTPSAPAADGRKSLGGFSVKVAEGFVEQPTRSGMRRAQWQVSGKDGDAELVVFYFGRAGAGSVERNLERWYGQFKQPDGRPSSEAAQTKSKIVAGMKVTRVEVAGHYVAETRPGSGKRLDKPNHRMLAAIVEAPDGAYYFKMVGPDTTVKGAATGFDSMIDSIATK